jgi:hypothetical protein
MDAQWNFRNAYNEAKKVKDAQDAFCQKVEAEEWDSLVGDQANFPENLQWESLVDVLRGRVKVSRVLLFFSNLLIDIPSSPFIATRFVPYMTRHKS